MSAQATRSGRAVRRTRRIQAFKSSARLFARNKMGVAGLAILTVFTLMALFADVLVPEARLSVTDAPGAPLEPPSSQFWLGTDELGRSVLDLVIQGSQISLLVGFLATAISMIGALVGITAGYFGGWTDVDPHAPHRLVPRHPFPASGHSARRSPGPRPVRDRVRHRDRHLAGTARVVRPGPDPQGTPLRRARQGPRRQRPPDHRPPHPPQRFPLIFANTILVVAVAIYTEAILSS